MNKKLSAFRINGEQINRCRENDYPAGLKMLNDEQIETAVKKGEKMQGQFFPLLFPQQDEL